MASNRSTVDTCQIKNLMAKSITSLMLNRDRDLFALFWSHTAEDVCLGFNNGWYIGQEAVAGYYAALGERLKLTARLLRERFPEKLSGQTDEELYGIGPFEAKPVTNPYVVVAEDGNTARGVWMSQGADTEIEIYGPLSRWTWGVYACDFVYEDNQWKFLHMQYLEDINHIMGQDWTREAVFPEEKAEFSELKSFRLPPYTVVTANRELYSIHRRYSPLPELPKPYKTMTPENSYGIREV